MKNPRYKHPAKRMLVMPSYSLADAARYARITLAAVRQWQRAPKPAARTRSRREHSVSLSFLQLIELRVVAALHEAGVALKAIRCARERLSDRFKIDFPFADLRFKVDAAHVLGALEGVPEAAAIKGCALVANRRGQYSWEKTVVSVFDEFEYGDAAVDRWHVAGKRSPVLIDPGVAFGAPQVRGIPTAVIKSRVGGGESSVEIGRDFRLTQKLVMAALEFERAV